MWIMGEENENRWESVQNVMTSFRAALHEIRTKMKSRNRTGNADNLST
jgi:hypothetical protein